MNPSLVFALVVSVTLISGCNNRSRGPGTSDPLCPDFAVSSGDPCDESQSGISCGGTVACSCGSRPTSCTCTTSGGFYSFNCLDSCSCSTPDSGTGGGARCGTLYDRLQGSSCPYPPDLFTRDDFVAQCNSLAAMSADCRAELDAYLSCALSAPIECMDVGDGMRFPTIPSCGELSSMCLGE